MSILEILLKYYSLKVVPLQTVLILLSKSLCSGEKIEDRPTRKSGKLVYKMVNR